jgi:hypothetical protein
MTSHLPEGRRRVEGAEQVTKAQELVEKIEEFIIAMHYNTLNPRPQAEDAVRWSDAKRDLTEFIEKEVTRGT